LNAPGYDHITSGMADMSDQFNNSGGKLYMEEGDVEALKRSNKVLGGE
jgi:phosphomethylpyrimidine synthase